MNFALIENDVVVNTIICGSMDEVKRLYPDVIIINIDNIVAGVDWSYDGSKFIEPLDFDSHRPEV